MTLEHSIGRLLTIATIAGVVVLSLGLAAMIAAGISPLDPAPPFELAAIPAAVARLDPAAVLWLGLLVVIATPPLRVAAALVGFAARGERRMVLVASGVLALIALGIVLGLTAG